MSTSGLWIRVWMSPCVDVTLLASQGGAECGHLSVPPGVLGIEKAVRRLRPFERVQLPGSAVEVARFSP